jgi:hypothetical protein
MSRLLRAAAAAATTLCLSVAAAAFASAPAEAVGMPTLPTQSKVEVTLDHADLVDVYNDPFAAGVICGEILRWVEDNQVVASPVTSSTVPMM